MKINNVMSLLQTLTSEDWECNVPQGEITQMKIELLKLFYRLKQNIKESLPELTYEECRLAEQSKLKAVKNYKQRTDCNLQESVLTVNNYLNNLNK